MIKYDMKNYYYTIPGTLLFIRVYNNCFRHLVYFILSDKFYLNIDLCLCNGSVLRLNMDNVSCSLIKRDFYEDQDQS